MDTQQKRPLLISFLGMGNYSTETYVYEGKNATQFAQIAVATFLQPRKTLVFITQGAKQKNGQALEQQFKAHNLDCQWVDIPDGKNEAELWGLFDNLTFHIQEQDEIIFDITFSFRSLPVLAFIAASYLRVVRKAHLKKVVYGAIEAKNPDGTAPIFDLTPFLTLLEWTTATYLFTTTGDAQPLAQQLINSGWASGHDAAQLRTLTDALRLTRVGEARRLAYEFAQLLEQLGPPELAARPFALLRERILAELQEIVGENPQSVNLVEELRAEYKLFEWNYQRGQYLSAVTVAREWLVSLFCCKLKWDGEVPEGTQSVPAWTTKGVRGKAETALNKLAKHLEQSENDQQKTSRSLNKDAYRLLKAKPEFAKMLGEGWRITSNLRNDLNHAGKIHTTTPRSIADILSQIPQVHQQLLRIYQNANFANETL